MPRPAEARDFAPDRAGLRRDLLRWFRHHGRDLPWRRTHDPYAILVSEFMLQQTQVATVLPYYARWLTRFPDFARLARAAEADVLHAWQGLGYYARARNLQAAAQLVVEKHGGALPANLAVIAQLPGVGRYTAGAVASFAFDLPAPIIEANTARVLARLMNLHLPIDSAAGRARLWQAATALLPDNGARAHNSALLDLGATVCLPRAPRCGACPVTNYCRARSPAALPRRKRRPELVRLTEDHAFGLRDGRVLLEQARERWRGMWILPRLSRAPAMPPLLRLDFPFTHHRVALTVFPLPAAFLPNERQNWFQLDQVEALPMPSPHRRALRQLLVGRESPAFA